MAPGASTGSSSSTSSSAFKTTLEGLSSLFRKIPFLPSTSTSYGDVWQDQQASKAYKSGSLTSQSTTGGGLRVAFRNVSKVPLILCWVAENGTLHHFYKLPPTTTTTTTTDPTTTMITENDHIEHTNCGHAFCIAYIPDEKILQTYKSSKSITDMSCIIGGYRPQKKVNNNQKQNDEVFDDVHLVTISRQRPSSSSKEETICCGGGIGGGGGGGGGGPPLFGLRGFGSRKRTLPFDDDEDDEENENDNNDLSNNNNNSRQWMIHIQHATLDPTPFDTTTKVYQRKILGGWPVYVEPNWHDGNKQLEHRLAEDLKYVTKVLPPHARDYLKENCPIWVNKSLKFGAKVCPTTGRGCCYHPDSQWLEENGMNPKKALCVEINDGPGYGKDLPLWGIGGVMVHEFSHAYHHRLLQDGYKNQEIIDCYEAAMKDGLYDCVAVHGTQGPKTRAYACTNCMEYFAELSTAFLGGINTTTKEEDDDDDDEYEEYNKWFPFNRQQLKEHDPRAYKLLSRLWKIDC